MPVFAFAGRTRRGQSVNGERTAESREAAVAALRREEIVVTRINPVAAKVASDSRRRAGRAVPSKNVAVFTRQLSVMIDAGLPLVQCLQILSLQEPHAAFAKMIGHTRAEVESGRSLAEAMRKSPEAFDELYTSMVAAGEASGSLDSILKRLATHIEKNVKLKSQVKSAMVYPIAVMVISAIVVAVILWKVIPTFAAMFTALGAQLPLPTRLVIGASQSVARVGPLALLGVIGLAVLIRSQYATAKGRRVIDRWLLRVPIVGMILRKVAVARFCRTLSTLLGSGVPILEGLSITAKTSGNAIVEDAVMATRVGTERGESVAATIGATGVFPPMVTQMISVGETTGALDMMLSKIADFYEAEVDTAVTSLLTLLEPLMISVLGVVVGGIVIAMYLPILDLLSQLS